MQNDVIGDCDVDRNEDYLYRILTSDDSIERDQVFSGVKQLIKEHNRHPCSAEVLSAATGNKMLTVSLILLAMHKDTSMQQHFIDHKGTCADTVSQYIHEVLPRHVSALLQGRASLEYFVCSAILDYATI